MNKNIKDLTMAAMFLALGLILPFFTGQIQVIGTMLLPMHIPVLLCGLICGWKYGGIVGFVVPLLRGVLFGMPIFYPTGIAMAFELMTYGIVIALLYKMSPWKCVRALYRSLIGAMLIGRVVWGISMIFLLGLNNFTWQAFLSGAFTGSVPGIILQLVLIPAIMIALDKVGIVRFSRPETAKD